MKSLAKFFNHDFKNGSFKLYDNNGKEIYYENSYRYWSKREYDNNKVTYWEDLNGIIRDNRPTCNNKTVIVDGIEYKLVRKDK